MIFFGNKNFNCANGQPNASCLMQRKQPMLLLLKKRFLRFSVRSLLAATTVLGALLGLIGNEANCLRHHRQAVRKIHELGGRYVPVTGNSYELGRGPFWCPVVRDSFYA